LVPVGTLLIADVAGATTLAAAWIAVVASTVLLTVYGFLAGRRGGLGLGGSLASASIGAALGILIILMKAGLH
jgi:hypothetical protein